MAAVSSGIAPRDAQAAAMVRDGAAVATRASGGQARAPARRRAALLIGVLACAGVAAALAVPSPAMLADADLAFVMRGMAAVKALILLAAIGLLLWRFGRPLSRGFALAYLAGAWLMAAATTLIGLLAAVPLAAVAFHAGEFTLLLAAWRDVREPR